MGTKEPQQFEVGDVIKNNANTPYSGSPITKVTDLRDGRTQALFKNGEIVEFFNEVPHEMQE